MFDLTILGEISLDTLVTGTPYTRPGGAMYSALAGRGAGARTAVLGYVGLEGQRWVRSLLGNRGVNHTQLRLKDRPTNRFHLYNVDEVEETSAERQDSGLPATVPPFTPVETRSLLVYACPSKIVQQAIDACPGAMVCLDLQYDLESWGDIESLLKRCHIVLASRDQAMKFFASPSVEEMAQKILAQGPDVVVVKSGLAGSTIFSKDTRTEIPRYDADWQQSVGAGDVYNAVFVATYLASSDLHQAGNSAALAAAAFCESDGSILLQDWPPLDAAKPGRDRMYVDPDFLTKAPVYLAAPFFNQPEAELVDRIKRMLEYHGFRVHSPKDTDGMVELSNPVECLRTYSNDMQALTSSCAVVALLDSSDPGTVFEAGYAVSSGIPVVSLWTGRRDGLNLMLSQGTRVVRNNRQLILALLEEVYKLQ